jgi:hypothetical protein
VRARLYDWLGYLVESLDLPPGNPPKIVIRGDDAFVRESNSLPPLGKVDYHQATWWNCPDTVELGRLGEDKDHG